MSSRQPALVPIRAMRVRTASIVGTAPRKAGNAASVSKGANPLRGATRADDSNCAARFKLQVPASDVA
jgi:hypothetical protein